MEDHSINAEIPQNPEPPKDKKGRNKNALIYGILILALVATWAYLLWDKTNSSQKQSQLQAQVVQIDSTRANVEQQFQAALVKLDMLKTENDSLMKTKSKEVDDLKARIQNILSKKNSSEADLAKARELTRQLQNQISGYKTEIEKLKGEKIVLVAQRDSIKRNYDTATAKNQELSQQVAIASILHASNFDITPLKLKNSGKEKETDKAKRADLLRISFDIVPNRVTDSGQKELFICINTPDGAPIAVEDLGSGKFTLEDGTEKLYTTKKVIDYNPGEAQKVTINWKQKSDFQPGQYTVEVYELGRLIGQGAVNLKKGGFIF